MITTLQTIVFLSYIAYLYFKVGLLSSISASSYALNKYERWLFYAFCVTLALLNLLQGMGGWGFFASAGLVFSGTTLNHREELTGKVHVVATVVAVMCSLIGLWVVEGMWWPLLVSGIGVALSLKTERPIWWSEILIISVNLLAYVLR